MNSFIYEKTLNAKLSNRSTSLYQLYDLLRDPDLAVSSMLFLVEHENADDKMFNYVLDRVSDYVLISATLLPKNFEAMQVAIGSHKNATPAVLTRLQGSRNSQVIRAVVGNENADRSILTYIANRLMENWEIWVRQDAPLTRQSMVQIANHANASPDLLITLLEKKVPTALMNRNFPQEHIRLIVRDCDVISMDGIARNPKTPSDILDILALRFDATYVVAIAENPRLSTYALETLYSRPDLQLGFRQKMAKHTNASTELLWRMANQEKDYTLLQSVVDHLAANEASKVLALLIMN